MPTGQQLAWRLKTGLPARTPLIALAHLVARPGLEDRSVKIANRKHGLSLFDGSHAAPACLARRHNEGRYYRAPRSLIEAELFGQPDLRAKWKDSYGKPREIQGHAVDEHISRLREQLMPLVERFHRLGRRCSLRDDV